MRCRQALGKVLLSMYGKLSTPGLFYSVKVHQGRLGENESRKYFQQLIDAVDFCHSKGVYHRDLKVPCLQLDCFGLVLQI